MGFRIVFPETLLEIENSLCVRSLLKVVLIFITIVLTPGILLRAILDFKFTIKIPSIFWSTSPFSIIKVKKKPIHKRAK